MRTKTALQQKIAALTNNGDDILRFLAETMRGEIPGAKACHRMEAARHLMRLDSSDDTLRHSCGGRNPAGQGEGHGEGNSQFWGLIPTPEELAAKQEDQQSPLSPRERARVRGNECTPSPINARHSCEGRNPEGRGGETDNSKLTTENSPVTHLDILNYDVAHLIRSETADGHTIVEFLADVMNSRDKPYIPKRLRIRQTDRMAAAREIMRRGFGHFGRRRKLVHDDYEANDYDTLHTDLAKRMREYSEHGADVIRFLLDVMSDTSLDPEEAYTWHQRTSAAMELLRRGWDTNYDKITPEMLQAYWRDQQSSRLSVGQKKQLAGLPTFTDEYDQYDTTDYQAIAKELRESEAREEAQPEHPTKNPPLPAGEGWGEGKSPFPKIESNNSEATTPRHPRESENPAETNGAEKIPLSPQVTRHSCESRNPVGQGQGAETTNPFVLSPVLSQSKGLSKDESASNRKNTEAIANRHSCESRNPVGQGAGYDGNEPSSPSCTSMSVLPDDLDCYYEPLTPEDQAIFNYNSLIESGEFEEGEITFVPPSEAAHRDYAIALKQIREAAEAEGVPLLPNPLAGTLRRPAIRSP